MTDAEIIRALEWCIQSESCEYCEYREKTNMIDVCPIRQDALDLIKRQQAEIERLTDLLVCSAESERNAVGIMHELEAEVEKLHPYNLHYGNLRMEIAREVCDRLKDSLHSVPTVYNSHFGRIIDNLVKEMEKEDE